MSSFINKLNLRPGELRLVVVVASVIVVVLYTLFILPQFQEWSVLKKKKNEIEQTMQRYRKEIERGPRYTEDLLRLQRKGGKVASADQALDLQRILTSQGALNGVSINVYTPGRGPAGGGKTNSYFEEQTGTINFVAEETSLVNYLYSLSSGDSLIRVSSMTLNPEQPSRMKLMGNMTCVASYRKAPPKAATPTVPSGAGPAAARAVATGARPQSISAAVSASTRTAVTNRPPAVSWWGKVKSFFGSSQPKSTASVTNAPARLPARTNAPPARR